jgi:hypothetical protein
MARESLRAMEPQPMMPKRTGLGGSSGGGTAVDDIASGMWSRDLPAGTRIENRRALGGFSGWLNKNAAPESATAISPPVLNRFENKEDRLLFSAHLI